MFKQLSIAEAKNRLPAIIHGVEEGEAVELTRRGRPVAVIISSREYKLLTHSGEGYWQALNKFRQNLQKGDFTIADADFAGLRDQSPAREDELCR